MKMFEYAGKELFGRYGIPIPGGRVVFSPDEAVACAREIGFPVVVKVQILSGGRGKAGGIKFCDDETAVRDAAGQLLGSEIRGLTVDRLLIERKLNIEREFYMGLVVDASRRCPLLMFSTHGGVDIEQVADEHIARVPIDVCFGVSPYMIREAGEPLGVTGKLAADLAEIADRLYRLQQEMDAEMVEINPLVISDGRLIAADSRCVIDDFAMYRQPDVPKNPEGTPLELENRAQGLAFVELDGDIALMCNGAGVTMATIDMLTQYGGRAANFLDAGGGAGIEPTVLGIRALLKTNPSAILISIFGGITKCDDVAKAIARVLDEDGTAVPIVARLTGINVDVAAEILKPYGIEPIERLEDAVERAVAVARGGV